MKIKYVVIASLILKILLIFYLYPNKERMFNGDSAVYEGLAISLLEKQQYEYLPKGINSDLIRPPGYPIVIYCTYWLFGQHYIIPILLNIFLFLAIVLSLKKLTEIIGIIDYKIVIFLITIDLGWTIQSSQLVAEPLFTPILLLSTLFLILYIKQNNVQNLIYSAALLGICSLIKPITLYLPIIIAFYLLIKKNYLNTCIYLTVSFLVVFPWILRNKLIHDSYVFTSIQNDNLALAHCSYVFADINHITFLQAQDSIDKKIEEQFATSSIKSFKKLNNIKGEFATEYIKEHPITYLKCIVKGITTTFLDPGRIAWNIAFPNEDIHQMGLNNYISKEGLIGTFKIFLKKDTLMVVVLTTYIIFLLLIAVVSILGINTFYKNNKDVFIIITIIVFYLLLLGGPIGNARFRLYILPFLLIYFGFGVERLKYWRRNGYKLTL